MKTDNTINDSVLYQKKLFDGERRSLDWLRVAYNSYNRLSEFRKHRKVCKDYAYGKQFDKMMNVNGKMMTKKEYLEKMGLPAIQFNTLGKNKRVIQGQYRLNDVAPICHAADPEEKQYADVLSELLKQNGKMNDRNEMDARQFEEFLISGFAAYKICYTHRKGKDDVFVDSVNPNMIFFPYTIYPDLGDVNHIGMINSFDFRHIIKMFSHSRQDSKRLAEIYQHCNEDDYIVSTYSTDKRVLDISCTDFYKPTEYGKCRVIELWSMERREAYLIDDPQEPNRYYRPYTKAVKDELDKENEQRKELNRMRDLDGSPQIDDMGEEMYFQEPESYDKEQLIKYEFAVEEYWYYRYMTPDGYILEEGVSPYWNGGESMHPFVCKPYPFVDGEIHSHVEEMIPAQDYLNYYMVALDFYMKNAAKGVMMVDEESISPNQSLEEMTDQFIRTNGVILYTSRNGAQAPKVETAGSIPGGFDYIIQLSKTMGEDVSGAQASLQGKQESSGMSGVLYNQMLNQAATSLADLMGAFNNFLEKTAMKVVKIIQCCYRGEKSVSVCGETIVADMDTICDVDTDISIAQNTNTPTYRALNNNFLINAGVQLGIPPKVIMKSIEMPGTERLMQLWDQEEQQQQQQAMAAQQQAMAAQSAAQGQPQDMEAGNQAQEMAIPIQGQPQ